VRQIESLAWLDDPDLAVLSQLPPALLGRLVDLVQQVGISSEQRTRVIEWVLKHGPADARDRAAETLEQRHSDYVADLVARELNSPDAEIQAWATSQLRAHAVPNAFEELIHRLDSPIAEVREAARKELDDFNVKRLLELHDQIPPAVCRQAGELLLKIHPEALGELRHELTHPIRSKKLRAARCVAAAGLQEPLIEGLAAMLDDDDAMVRRAAVEALGSCRHPLTATLLARMTHDASPRVRTAAESALAQLAASAPAGDQGKAPPHPQEPSSWPIPTVS
jgi:HEAT repeat protein